MDRGERKGTNRGQIKEQAEKEQRDKGKRASAPGKRRNPEGSSDVTFTPTESVLRPCRWKKVERDIQRTERVLPLRYRPPP